MEEFPGNSKTPRPVSAARIETNIPPKLPADWKEELEQNADRVYEPVITGAVTRKKKGLGRRFMDTFFAKDTDTVGNYVLHEVLLPTLRDLLTNAVTSTVERAVYGDKAPPPRSNGSYRGSSTNRPTTINYNQASRPAAAPSRRPITQPSSVDIGLIVLDSKMDADTVADRMFDELRQYGSVTVAALYGFMNQSSTYMDNKFGWEDLDSMHVIRQRDGGWLLDLPQPIDLRQR